MNLTPKQKRLLQANNQASARVRRMVTPNMGASARSIPRAVSAPISMASTIRNVQPRISYNGSNSCCISHRELIATISQSVNFSTTSYALNPGLVSTFPWLAPMAAQWEQYRFKRLSFQYVTRTSTTTAGSILLAPDYDASDSSPSSEINMASYQDSVEDVPWKNLECRLNTASMHVIQARKYLRTSAIPSGTDVKLYDVGNFFVGTTGGANDTDAVGKLYVDYEVEFFIPQKEASAGSGSSFAVRQATVATPTGAMKLCSTPTTVIGSPVSSSGDFTVPKGNWLVTASCSISAAGSSSLKIYISGVAQTGLEFFFNSTGATATFPLSLSTSTVVAIEFNGGNITLTNAILVFTALC